MEKDIYRIKIELRSWRIVISLKFDDIFVTLQKFTLYDNPTDRKTERDETAVIHIKIYRYSEENDENQSIVEAGGISF